MFRTKKKSGAAPRKRRDLDDEYADEDVEKKIFDAEPMELDDGDVVSTEGAGKGSSDDEDALLARMRSRTQRAKSKTGGSMAFSSKAKKTSRSLGDDDTMTGPASAGGGLSFDEDLGSQGSKRTKKLRIRPNLSVTQTNENGGDGAENVPSRYSQDMLASLLKEQKVLQRRPIVDTDVDLIEVDGDASGREMNPFIDEETKGDAVDEDFIPLNSQIMQEKKNKKRVTFGIHNAEYYPPKNTEVEEPVSASDDEVAEEESQSKHWEEELMRRGGGRDVSQQHKLAPHLDRATEYPTRKAVPCSSLGEVMRNIQRKVVAGSTERDRASRELARLEAETELLEKRQSKQRVALHVSSEEFEYFQVVEDYVKGLSFCLREKLPVIEAEEAKQNSSWSTSTAKLRELRLKDIHDELYLILRTGTVHKRQFINLPSSVGDSSFATGNDEDNRLTRFRTRYEAPYSSEEVYSGWNIFSDAVDDIKSLERVYSRFQEWKNKFPDVYKNAYTDLALVKLYAPYIRVELINWDPLTTASSTPAGIKRLDRVSSMGWLKTLRLHQTEQQACELEEPVSSLLREIVIARVADAAHNRFDAFSSVHTQSVADLVEDLAQLGALKYVEHSLEDIVSTLLSALTDEAKRLPLLSLGGQEGSTDRVRIFAQFLLGEFNVLLENTLTLFVALPSGSLHERGFNAVMQLLHQLLAYINHCRHLDKASMLTQVKPTIQQLSSSSFMQSLLARSKREQFEFQHILQLLTSPGA